MLKIMLIQQHSAFTSAQAREAQDLGLALAAVEHQVTLLYREAAVLQLVAARANADAGYKDFTPAQKLFSLYDIKQVCVCMDSLALYQLTATDLRIPVSVLDLEQQRLLLAQQQHVIMC